MCLEAVWAEREEKQREERAGPPIKRGIRGKIPHQSETTKKGREKGKGGRVFLTSNPFMC